MSFDKNFPWVPLRIRDQLFGVPADGVREMAELLDHINSIEQGMARMERDCEELDQAA